MIRYIEARPLPSERLLIWAPVIGLIGALFGLLTVVAVGFIIIWLVAIIALPIWLGFAHRWYPFWPAVQHMRIEMAAMYAGFVLASGLMSVGYAGSVYFLTELTIFCMPAWIVTGFIGIITLAILRWLWPPSPWWKPSKPRCPQCQYLLIGVKEHRCPECGRPFTLAELGLSESFLRPSGYRNV